MMLVRHLLITILLVIIWLGILIVTNTLGEIGLLKSFIAGILLGVLATLISIKLEESKE